MWFLWLNWRKSTFYPVTAPNDSKCWPIVTSSIQKPVASNCDVTMTDCSHVVAMDAFLAQWCWGQFVKDTFFNIIMIMKNICEAVKCLASDIMINWQRTMRTARNNGFDQIVAAGYHENLNVMIKLVKGNTRREYNGFGHIARVVSIVVFLAHWCWSQFVNTRLCQVIPVSLRYRNVTVDWPRAWQPCRTHGTMHLMNCARVWYMYWTN